MWGSSLTSCVPIEIFMFYEIGKNKEIKRKSFTKREVFAFT
jgi:hypothetical protein